MAYLAMPLNMGAVTSVVFNGPEGTGVCVTFSSSDISSPTQQGFYLVGHGGGNLTTLIRSPLTS